MTMDERLFLAPLASPQHVLDIATGTGIWAIEFGNLCYPCSKLDHKLTCRTAQENPGSSVLGTDLSPIQPA